MNDIQHFRILDPSRLGGLQPASLLQLGNELTLKFGDPRSMLHLKTAQQSTSSTWQEIEKPLPTGETSRPPETSADTNIMRQGTVIQKFQTTPKPGQSLESFRKQVEQSPAPARPPASKAVVPPKKDANYRLFSRVEEVKTAKAQEAQPSLPEKSMEAAKISSAQPASPPASPNIIQRQTDFAPTQAETGQQSISPEPIRKGKLSDTDDALELPEQVMAKPQPAKVEQPKTTPENKLRETAQKGITEENAGNRTAEKKPGTPLPLPLAIQKLPAPDTNSKSLLTAKPQMQAPKTETRPVKAPVKGQKEEENLPVPNESVPGLSIEALAPRQAAQKAPDELPEKINSKVQAPLTEITPRIEAEKAVPVQRDTTPPAPSATKPAIEPLKAYVMQRKQAADQLRTSKPEQSKLMQSQAQPPLINSEPYKQRYAGNSSLPKATPQQTQPKPRGDSESPDEKFRPIFPSNFPAQSQEKPQAPFNIREVTSIQPQAIQAMDMPVAKQTGIKTTPVAEKTASSKPPALPATSPITEKPAPVQQASPPQKAVPSMSKTSGGVVQRLWEEHQEMDTSAHHGQGNGSGQNGEGGEINLDLLAEEIFPLVKRLLEIETERVSGHFR